MPTSPGFCFIGAVITYSLFVSQFRQVWFDDLAAPPAPSPAASQRRRFAPGARTNWHWHATGQTLPVTDGLARVGAVPATCLDPIWRDDTCERTSCTAPALSASKHCRIR